MTEEIESTESIADALLASMNEVESESETEETEVVSPVAEAAPEATEETDEAVEQVAADEEVEEDSEESEEPATVFSAPEHWSSDEREKFDALPPEAQEVLLERDKAFQTGYQEKAQAIAAISDAIEPWKEALAQRGVTADQAIRTLFAAQNTLDTNPLQGILQIAQSYGVVDQLRNQFAPETDDNDFTDPEVKALKLEIQSLRNQVTQATQGVQQQSTQALQQQIDAFKNATGENGLLHPHFEEVKQSMATFVQNGDTLDAAYDKAVWADPKIRQLQLAAQKKPVGKTDAEKAAKVKQAKKAARGVKTNGKIDPKLGTESLSLKDDLTLAYKQLSS